MDRNTYSYSPVGDLDNADDPIPIVSDNDIDDRKIQFVKLAVSVVLALASGVAFVDSIAGNGCNSVIRGLLVTLLVYELCVMVKLAYCLATGRRSKVSDITQTVYFVVKFGYAVFFTIVAVMDGQRCSPLATTLSRIIAPVLLVMLLLTQFMRDLS